MVRIAGTEYPPAPIPQNDTPRAQRLDAMRARVHDCRACPLFENATQGVMGRGPLDPDLMLVGEQPGDREDRDGEPFVGPAGTLLDDALADAGVVRRNTYVTNAVKHFKWVPRGTLRLHKSPGRAEVTACLPWLEAEIEAVRPRLLVALGATAGKVLLDREYRVTRQRGQLLESRFGPRVVGTVHPSAVLRVKGRPEWAEAYDRFVADLKFAATALAD